MPKQYILHVDGDAFFAACEVSRRPDLRGKPVVVGEERGIASALTYEAKKLGIHRGMPIFQIKRDFPHVTVLSSHFELYQEFAANLIELLGRYLPHVESYSIDECFAELPEMPEAAILPFIQKIKNVVQTSLGVTYSFGVAPTKTLAKIASKKEKPDGCVVLVDSKNIEQTLRETKIQSVWGIGYKTSERLLRRTVLTAADFIALKQEIIERDFSEPILEIWHELRGLRLRSVHTAHDEQKSISATRSLSKITDKRDYLFSELSRNIEIACADLRAQHLYTNSIHFYYAYKAPNGSRYKYRKSAKTNLKSYTQDAKTILRMIEPLVSLIYQKGLPYKATGVTFSNLRRREVVPIDLFGLQNADFEDKVHLGILDKLNHKFGQWSVLYASSLKSVQDRRADTLRRAATDSYEYNLPLPYMGEVY